MTTSSRSSQRACRNRPCRCISTRSCGAASRRRSTPFPRCFWLVPLGWSVCRSPRKMEDPYTPGGCRLEWRRARPLWTGLAAVPVCPRRFHGWRPASTAGIAVRLVFCLALPRRFPRGTCRRQPFRQDTGMVDRLHHRFCRVSFRLAVIIVNYAKEVMPLENTPLCPGHENQTHGPWNPK
jgi:hypothetical protein